MINPNQITKFDRTTAELQEFLLFAICVAGKNSAIQAQKLEDFLQLAKAEMESWGYNPTTPFDALDDFTTDEIDFLLRIVKMGQYARLSNLIYELVNSKLDLKTVTVPQLEQIYGIGPKTARFFVLHTQKDARCAALDTHVLKHLKACGVENVPKNTPSDKKTYKRLEDAFLAAYDGSHFAAAVTLAEYDLMIWQHYSAGNHKATK